jgi:hypothetical protein
MRFERVNAAKMREALHSLVDVIERLDGNNPLWWHNNALGVKALKTAKTALSAPPRNCDIGTAGEQGERFILFCRRNSFRGVCNDSCKFASVSRRLGWQKIGRARCFPFWSQMPYETIEQTKTKGE